MRYFCSRQPIDVAEYDSQPFLMRQSLQRFPHYLPLLFSRKPRMRIAGFACNSHLGIDGFRERVPSPLPTATDIPADVYGHLHEPWLDRLVRIEPVNVLKDSQEDFLCGVLGIVGASQQFHREVKYSALVSNYDLFESSRVAAEGALNQGSDLGNLIRTVGRREARHPKRSVDSSGIVWTWFDRHIVVLRVIPTLCANR